MLIRIDDRLPELKMLYEQLRELREFNAKTEQPLLKRIMYLENIRQPSYFVPKDEWDKISTDSITGLKDGLK